MTRRLLIKTAVQGFEYQKDLDEEKQSSLVLPVVKFFARLEEGQFFSLSVQKVITSFCII